MLLMLCWLITAQVSSLQPTLCPSLGSARMPVGCCCKMCAFRVVCAAVARAASRCCTAAVPRKSSETLSGLLITYRLGCNTKAAVQNTAKEGCHWKSMAYCGSMCCMSWQAPAAAHLSARTAAGLARPAPLTAAAHVDLGCQPEGMVRTACCLCLRSSSLVVHAPGNMYTTADMTRQQSCYQLTWLLQRPDICWHMQCRFWSGRHTWYLFAEALAARPGYCSQVCARNALLLHLQLSRLCYKKPQPTAPAGWRCRGKGLDSRSNIKSVKMSKDVWVANL